MNPPLNLHNFLNLSKVVITAKPEVGALSSRNPQVHKFSKQWGHSQSHLLINNLQRVFFNSDFCRSDAEVVSVYLYMGGAEHFYTG